MAYKVPIVPYAFYNSAYASDGRTVLYINLRIDKQRYDIT